LQACLLPLAVASKWIAYTKWNHKGCRRQKEEETQLQCPACAHVGPELNAHGAGWADNTEQHPDVIGSERKASTGRIPVSTETRVWRTHHIRHSNEVCSLGCQQWRCKEQSGAAATATLTDDSMPACVITCRLRDLCWLHYMVVRTMAG
jgi:hypothetical protein